MAPETATVLQRKRTTVRTKVTKLVTALNSSDKETGTEIDFMVSRLTEELDVLLRLDDDIHAVLNDEEYAIDVEKCDEYAEKAKRALYDASRNRNYSPSTTSPLVSNPMPVQAQLSSTSTPCGLKLPTIRLEPFRGCVEDWPTFWQQFTSSIDENPQLSTIDKHVFLRGYLEEEPKKLVEGIGVTSESYDTVKKMLNDRYGNKDIIIQTHVDFFDGLRPVTVSSPEILNQTYLEINARIQALRSLGEDVNQYSRVLTPKILRTFPSDIRQRWII